MKQQNEVQQTHTGLWHRGHSPFSAADISHEAYYSQGNEHVKVYKAVVYQILTESDPICHS